jgi:hypothetical protein
MSDVETRKMLTMLQTVMQALDKRITALENRQEFDIRLLSDR